MVTHMRGDAVAGEHRLNSPVAFAFGAVFVLLGITGCLVSGSHYVVGPDDGALLGIFQVNMLLNVVHLGAGAALVAAGILGTRQARLVNAAAGLGLLTLFVVGIVVIGTAANVLALNSADNALHFALGLALTAVGLRTDRVPR
jgi:hypothetical protein